MPGFSVRHYLPQFAQTHVHWVSGTIQPSHSRSPPSAALSLYQHQDLFNELALCIRWPKFWSSSFNISPSNEYSGLISFWIAWFDLLVLQRYLCCCSVAQLCPTLCDSMDCNMLGFPVLHYFPGFAQTHVH